MNNTVSSQLSRRISAMSLFAAILVVFIHSPHDAMPVGGFSYYICNFIGEGLCNIAVPFFFVISGFMLGKHVGEANWWKDAVSKRVRSVLMPYVFWCLVLSGVVTGTIVAVNILHHAAITRNIGSLFPWNFLGLNPFQNPPAPLWYLRTLFVFVLLSPIVSILVKGRAWIVTLPFLFIADIAAISFVCVKCPFVDKFFWFFFSLNGLFYFASGLVLQRSRISIRRGGGAFLLIAGIILTCIKIVNMEDKGIGLVAYFACDRVGVLLMLVGIWHLMPAIHLPKWLSSMSFPIYLMHMPFVTAMGLASAWLIPNYEKTWQAYVVIGVLAIFGSVLMAHLLRKCFPRFAKDIFGGR